MTFSGNSRAIRCALLASAAAGLGLSHPVLAQEVAGPVADRPAADAAERSSQGAGIMALDPADTLREAYARFPTGPDIVPAPEIVIANPGTPTTAIDPNNVTGVGQMVIDERNGFIGLCTATLINPRTVILAAHCVNERPANAYGENSGGQPIGFGFNSNNNAAGASAFGGWLNGVNGVKYATTTSRNMYDANYVSYNPLSLEPNAASFLYADIAVASLDTPAKGVPTWALLFSQLPTPATIGAAGTGYHVVIDGYGNNGTGTTGSTGGIDFRRRIAENMLGGLASLDEFENFLFGGNSTTNPQNLYWIDFDDPRRGTASASPFDFNAWRDNATPKEGITAAGDSGGPLILDAAYAKQLVIGVLSGGYTRFFNGQAANGYGTVAFYQPLYLYWDWVAANNPYHYVSALAGNGNWTDPTHWVSNLDPNYYVLTGGQPVNGVPTSPGTGNTDTAGFGQACFQSGGVSDCYDVATGTETVRTGPIGSAGNGSAMVDAATLISDVTNDSVKLTAGSLDGAAAGVIGTENVELAAQGGITTLALPAATLANGLPGATNFVPNNSDGNRLTNTAPRYFDVTLAAAGTTTLSSAATVDRFTISGGNAMLDVTAAGSLTSLMDITQGTGTMQVNGLLTSPGDYLMMSGGLNGTGTITVPFFTSMAGTIAPGTAGTVGTLNFRGNVILASGNTYMVDLGANGTSDRIAVAATTFATGGAATNGIANVGGRLALGFSGATLRANNLYTILTAQGGVTGTFLTSSSFSAILTPQLLYTPTSVQLRVVAGSYASVANGSPTQAAYARLLDQNRVQQGNYDALYGPLDLQSAATIRATLDSLAPATETTIRSLASASVDNMASFYRDRIASLDVTTTGGTFAKMGQPLTVAANNLGADRFGSAVRSDSVAVLVQEARLPENMSAFVAGGYLTGDSRPMTGVGGRDNFDGWYLAGGVERYDAEGGVVGFSIGYTQLDADTAFSGHKAAGDLYQGTLYTKAKLSNLTFDTQISAGKFSARTERGVSFIGTPYTLRSRDNALALNGEVGLSADLGAGLFEVMPRAALRASRVEFTPTIETGGPMALFYARQNLDSLQGRLGFNVAGRAAKVRPFVSATYVHDFVDRPGYVGANLVGGVGPNALFALNSQDHDWAEVSGGLTLRTGAVDLSVSAHSDVLRQDIASQSYRGSVSFRF